MSCLGIKEYEVLPNESFKIIHNCSGCGGKNIFLNTNSFRINANGNCIDVWLIYQCSKCKHTLNIPIYERIRPMDIKKEEYLKLLSNNKELAFKYGTDMQLMKKNKIEVEWSEMDYRIAACRSGDCECGYEICIHNPYQLRIRTEKILSEIMQISRLEIRKLMKSKKLLFNDKIVRSRTKVFFAGRDED